MKQLNQIQVLLNQFSSENSYTPEYSTQGNLIRMFNFGVDNSIKFLKSSYTQGLSELRDMEMESNGSEIDEQKVIKKTMYLKSIAKVKGELDTFRTQALKAHKEVIGSEYKPYVKGTSRQFTREEVLKEVKGLKDTI
jgi:hypothetical protein